MLSRSLGFCPLQTRLPLQRDAGEPIACAPFTRTHSRFLPVACGVLILFVLQSTTEAQTPLQPGYASGYVPQDLTLGVSASASVASHSEAVQVDRTLNRESHGPIRTLNPQTDSAELQTSADTTPLAPPSSKLLGPSETDRNSMGSFVSVISSLAFVLGTFLAITWLFKRFTPGSESGRIPAEAVELVGRGALGPKQQIALLRFGGKLVLCSQQQGELRPLSEITDSQQVADLIELCKSKATNPTLQSFSGSHAVVEERPRNRLLDAYEMLQSSRNKEARTQ